MAETGNSSPSLATPVPVATPAEVDQEAASGKQIQCRVCLRSDGDLIMALAILEQFAYAHCTTCKAPYYLRAHIPPDRKWSLPKWLKFRYILFIFAVIQIAICSSAFMVYLAHGNQLHLYGNYGYRHFFYDRYHGSWWQLSKAFDRELTWYYGQGVLLFCTVLGLSRCFITCYKRRICNSVAHSCKELPTSCSQTGMCAEYVPDKQNYCTTSFGICVNNKVECGFVGRADLVFLELLLIMSVVVLGLVTALGIFYSILVASIVGRQIWKHYYHKLTKRMLTKEYVVEDIDGEVTDWCPPPLPPDHAQQLKELGLL